MLILQALYLLLPAYLANMAPVICRCIPFLDVPLDFGRKIGKNPIFGPHKTWRGLIAGMMAAIAVSYLQYLGTSLEFLRDLSVIDYSAWPLVGLSLGFGAIAGDAIESHFKRKRGIPPGKPWIPFDQIDFVVGAFALLLVVENPGWLIASVGIALSFFLHITVNHIAFFLRIRKEKW